MWRVAQWIEHRDWFASHSLIKFLPLQAEVLRVIVNPLVAGSIPALLHQTILDFRLKLKSKIANFMWRVAQLVEFQTSLIHTLSERADDLRVIDY